MRFIRKKQSWSRYGAKLAVLSVCMATAGIMFMDRYRIGIDPQIEKCIPGITFYLIDLKDKQLERDGIYVFMAKGLEPLFKEGTQMVKFLRGMPGDTVEVTKDHRVMVAGQELGRGLFLTRELEQPVEKFIGKGVLKEGSYWFMGTSDRSFDSRYWGTVKDEQIIGRAYPLL
ncbi:S26 family signal peptidase [Alcaligenes faecalis]|uniref:S26 family signal peptidase n=1 Tax=Alcaligenes faecalis TaxID=511 RepID=UPI0024BC11D4|nr:S26 family signal peptidase [Alcaligenes faecalis]